MWPGYLHEDSSKATRSFCERQDIPLSTIHASSHATTQDLQRLASAIGADRIVPIHTAVPESPAVNCFGPIVVSGSAEASRERSGNELLCRCPAIALGFTREGK